MVIPVPLVQSGSGNLSSRGILRLVLRPITGKANSANPRLVLETLVDLCGRRLVVEGVAVVWNSRLETGILLSSGNPRLVLGGGKVLLVTLVDLCGRPLVVIEAVAVVSNPRLVLVSIGKVFLETFIDM